MYLYHCSTHRFKEFKLVYSEKQENMAEGIGIYMVDKNNFSTATGYGGITYKVEVNDRNIFNFCNRRVIKNMLSHVLRISAFVNSYPTIYNNIKEDFVEGVITGEICISDGYRELCNQFDSHEEFWNFYGDKTDKKLELTEERYKNYLNSRLVYKYFDKSIGIIYICIHDVEKLKIIGAYPTNKIEPSRLL